MKAVDLSNYDYDVDINDPDGWVPALQAAGVEAAIIGSQWMDKARWQLAKCKEYGLPVIGCYAEPDYDGAIELAQEAGAGIVPLAYETGSIQNHETLWAGVCAVRAAGLTPKIYGNMYDVSWAATDVRFHDIGLWFAGYFDDHHVITDLSWWPEVWAHQYTSTEYIAGKNRDMSQVFEEVLPLSALQDIADLKAIVIGNAFDAIPRPGTEDLFPEGTVIIPEGQDGPTVRLTGNAAFQYGVRRGFSLALALELNAQADAARA